MAAPVVASMPPGIELDGNYIVRLSALDAATGLAVSGVKISGVVITGNDLSTPPGLDDGEAAAQVAPLFVPLPADELIAQSG